MTHEEPPARTQADVAAAMSDLAEKARAFSDATKGQTSEQILAEMRGEETAREDDLTAAHSLMRY